LRTALDLALPPLCAACREPVEGKGLCPACWSKLSFITRPYCERLGIPFVYDPGPGILSMEAIADPQAYHRARAAVRFDETSRALVHGLKYADRLDRAPLIGRWTAHAGRELLADADALVPGRCIGAAAGCGASTNRRSWLESLRRKAGYRSRQRR
jgi:predicted amidophosphoribosyltransferase